MNRVAVQETPACHEHARGQEQLPQARERSALNCNECALVYFKSFMYLKIMINQLHFSNVHFVKRFILSPCYFAHIFKAHEKSLIVVLTVVH